MHCILYYHDMTEIFKYYNPKHHKLSNDNTMVTNIYNYCNSIVYSSMCIPFINSELVLMRQNI